MLDLLFIAFSLLYIVFYFLIKLINFILLDSFNKPLVFGTFQCLFILPFVVFYLFSIFLNFDLHLFHFLFLLHNFCCFLLKLNICVEQILQLSVSFTLGLKSASMFLGPLLMPLLFLQSCLFVLLLKDFNLSFQELHFLLLLLDDFLRCLGFTVQIRVLFFQFFKCFCLLI